MLRRPTWLLKRLFSIVRDADSSDTGDEVVEDAILDSPVLDGSRIDGDGGGAEVEDL